MSILETPRILFRGNMSWDPIVTNNKARFYDETTGTTELPKGAGADAKAFRSRVEAYRKEAIAGNFWNVHGTHRSSFYDLAEADPTCPQSAIGASEIYGVDLGKGTAADALVGSPVRFTGMLVDLEPYGNSSSQLFFEKMTFGIAGASRIVARRRTKVTARYVNFRRNSAGAIAGVASIVWQTSFDKAGLQIDVLDSAGLRTLANALNDADVLGLTVRWYNYRTIYFDTPVPNNQDPRMAALQQALVKKLTISDPAGNNVFQPNPARSKMVGSVGLWRRGEPAEEPGDRALVPPDAQQIATAFARVDGDRLTIDLGNSIPETGLDLNKRDFGPIEVHAVGQGHADQLLATLSPADYDLQAYEGASGLVTKTIDSTKFVETDSLELRASGATLLQEQPVRIVPNEPNIYADEGDKRSTTFQILVHGKPQRQPVRSVKLVQCTSEFKPIGEIPLIADANGVVSFNVPTKDAGVSVYIPLADSQTFTPGPGITQQYTYLNVRCLPADDLVAALQGTWDNVYCQVLSNWNALAPCMDNWLDLYDPAAVHAYGSVIKRLTDPANRESFLFMPVTRDMTKGQRTLLYAFLDGAPGSKSLLKAKVELDDGAGSFVKLNQAMRAPSVLENKN
jgi:hypothetical protein